MKIVYKIQFLKWFLFNCFPFIKLRKNKNKWKLLNTMSGEQAG